MFFDKDKNITDKAFLIKISVNFMVMCLCLAVLCFETYAWFGVESDGYAIPDVFELEVSVVKLEDGVESDSVAAVKDEKGVWSCTLKTVGSYKITLVRISELNDRGYCFLTVGNGKKQPTEMISSDEPFIFTITTTKANTKVSFEPWWGIPYAPVVGNNGIFEVNQVQNDAK